MIITTNMRSMWKLIPDGEWLSKGYLLSSLKETVLHKSNIGKELMTAC